MLIVGLGNPGKKYENTRHNIGFMVLDKIAEITRGSWKSGFKGEYAIVNIEGANHYLLKPHTYMNLSGESVGEITRYYKIPTDKMLIAHDELDFEFGRLKLRKGGSPAGHNGIKSVIQHTGTEMFYRLRMGIAGMPRSSIRGSTADYVLAPFTLTEQETLDRFVIEGAEAAIDCAVIGVEKAMLKYNKKPEISNSKQ